MVEVGVDARGEPVFQTSEAAVEALGRRWDELWRQAGLERDPARQEVLAELAIRPRTLKEVKRRVVKSGVHPKDTGRAARELAGAGLVTEDLKQAYIVS